MLDPKLKTLICTAEQKSFTSAAKLLSLTQPAVSHHIRLLEEELGVKIFARNKNELILTPEGEIVLRGARRMNAICERIYSELSDKTHCLTRLRVGITHTAESNLMTEVLARYSQSVEHMTIKIITDTINNLYAMLENYELDLAITDGKPVGRELRSLLLDTDYLVCVMSNENQLASREMVTLGELKKQKMILRLPTSATRILFESQLDGIGESTADFDILLEVDSVAAIKDLIRKNLGVSILARSACMDELSKGKLTALPIENLSMVRETNLVYHDDFGHEEILKSIMKVYRETARAYTRTYM
ncbi:MAG TPA: LysR family transcriptional regulator [Firmicutes bacterium]|nr:LysR family transcriptional regulator [Bacillota bacterium]